MQEVRVSLCVSCDRFERGVCICHVQSFGRCRDGGRGVVRIQRADFGEGEEAFGIGFRGTGAGDELGEAGTEQRHRKLALGRLMERGDQGAELALLDILELVHEEHQRGALVAGGGTGGAEKVAEVLVENAAVGEAPLAAEFHAELETLIRDLHGAHEPGQRPKRPLGRVTGRRATVHFDEGHAQRRREQVGQGAILRGFQPNGLESAAFGVPRDPVEKDGLADPAQAGQQQALRRPPVADAVEGNRRFVDQRAAARQFRRRRAGARRVGVGSRIHFNRGYPSLPRMGNLG